MPIGTLRIAKPFTSIKHPRMYKSMKTMFFVLIAILLSCSQTKDNQSKDLELDDAPNGQEHSISKMTSEQDAALEAFNVLQMSTDHMNSLYSTFPNNNLICYPPDSIFVLSQASFLNAMRHFVEKNCTKLPPVEGDELAAAAALAQENYKVSFCPNHLNKVNDRHGLPFSGTWVLRGLLGRRDVVLVW